MAVQRFDQLLNNIKIVFPNGFWFNRRLEIQESRYPLITPQIGSACPRIPLQYPTTIMPLTCLIPLHIHSATWDSWTSKKGEFLQYFSFRSFTQRQSFLQSSPNLTQLGTLGHSSFAFQFHPTPLAYKSNFKPSDNSVFFLHQRIPTKNILAWHVVVWNWHTATIWISTDLPTSETAFSFHHATWLMMFSL